MKSYVLFAARYPAAIAAFLYRMALAPVALTLSVGLAAVFVTVKRTAMRAPVARTKPVQLTALAAVSAAVEQVP